MGRLTDLKPWHPAIWLIVFSILTAWAAGSKLMEARWQWAQITDHGATTPLNEPALLTQPLAVIWPPVPWLEPLAFTLLDSSRSQTGLLPYSDVNPRRWQVAPADTTTYHIIWLEQNNRLRSALVNSTGETMRGPIDLAPEAQPDFETLSLSDGRLLVLWCSQRTAKISALIIDSAGRPGPITLLSPERVALLAARQDRAGLIHLTWLNSPRPDHWEIYYQTSGLNPVVVETPALLTTFTLAPGQSLAAFQMGLDETHGYIFWSIATAESPAVEQVWALTFPLDAPAEVVIAELALPGRFTPSRRDVTALHIGPMASLTTPPTQSAPLRWLRPASGQPAILPVAVALCTPDGWRPAIIYYRHGETLGFQVVAPLPANAGPSTLHTDLTGNLILAWSGLAGMTPHLYTAYTSGKGLVHVPAPSDRAVTRTFAGALAGLPLGLLWLVLPVWIVRVAPMNTWTLPLVLAVYSTGKLIWPTTLFTRLPPLLAATGLEQQIAANWIVGGVVLLIGFTAGGAWLLAGRLKRPDGQTGLVYPLVDALLTWIIFGANVFS